MNETFDSMIELDEAVANAVAEILTCSPAAVRAAKKLITNVASKQVLLKTFLFFFKKIFFFLLESSFLVRKQKIMLLMQSHQLE